MNILITAGPTREHLDPVRFFSNASSGRMGILLAEEANRRNHEVSLVLGPTTLQPDESLDEVQDITTADEMRTAVFERFDRCDVLIMTAAVCDIRPTHRSSEKQKKDELGHQIPIEQTPDILEEAGRRRAEQTLVGFAVESQDLLEHAKTKFQSKNLDLLVLNRPEAMGNQRNRVHLYNGSDALESWAEQDKAELADQLMDHIIDLVEQSRRF